MRCRRRRKVLWFGLSGASYSAADHFCPGCPAGAETFPGMIRCRAMQLLAEFQHMALGYLWRPRPGSGSCNLSPLHFSAPVEHLQASIAAFGNRNLPTRRRVPAFAFDLQKSSPVSHHPVLADGAFFLQPESRVQFPFPRRFAVIILSLDGLPPESPVVIRQIVLPQISICFLRRADPVQAQFLDQ